MMPDKHTTELERVSAYIEDGELNVLVSTPCETTGEDDLRWVVTANPETKSIDNVVFCIATDEGFDYPDYVPTAGQMSVFQRFVEDSVQELEKVKDGDPR